MAARLTRNTVAEQAKRVEGRTIVPRRLDGTGGHGEHRLVVKHW